MFMGKILVTSALPYANGDIHLGHLAGCYLPADIYVRYQRMKKRDVIHIGGTDEHGVPITIKARQEGKSPKEIVDYYHKRIKESFEKFGIIFDNFSRTTKPIHYEITKEFFLRIYNRGYIEKRTTEQFYCTQCGMFLADRYVEGTCPYCGYEEARGDQCEKCGRWLEPFMLKNPRCKICGSTPERRSTFHYYFKLDMLQKELEEWIASKTHWKDNVTRFTKGWFKEGLEPRAITRDISWGVPVPLKEAEGKVFYVWFDAPIGYISSTVEWAEKKGDKELWKDYWMSPDTRLIHFIGKDNIVFHAIVWPAMLMAHGDFILPSDIPANEFLTLEGRPLSTSRNWAVWLPEYLEEFPPDPLRYAIASNAPENRDVDFRWKDFQARNNNELADIYGNFVNRVIQFSAKYLGGRIPELTSLSSESTEVLKRVEELFMKTQEMYENFRVKEAVRLFMEIAQEGNRYFDYSEPWRTRKEDMDKCNETIGVCFRIIKMLAQVSSPVLPFTAEKVRRQLRLDSLDMVVEHEMGTEIGEPEILFRKIDDRTIELKIEELGKGKKEKEEKIMDRISIEEFKKIQLKIAKILEAEKVEGADRLLKLKVSLGDEERTLVAGIAQFYSPEELIGKEIVVVANLMPAKIRGIESNGMLLAAVKGDRLALLIPDKEIEPGTPVS